MSLPAIGHLIINYGMQAPESDKLKIKIEKVISRCAEC